MSILNFFLNIKQFKGTMEFMTHKPFLSHFFLNLALGSGVILASLFAGMWGYRYFENMTWVDAYENASMILAGMGPVKELTTVGGKLFAGTYALFSGIIFLVIMAIIFSPVIKRFFRELHMED